MKKKFFMPKPTGKNIKIMQEMVFPELNNITLEKLDQQLY